MGDTDASDPSYETMNTLCHSGHTEGIINCGSIITGRFITIMNDYYLHDPTNKLHLQFAEIFAFQEYDLASTATILGVNAIIDTSYQLNGSSDGILGSNYCVEYVVSDTSIDPQIMILLSEPTTVNGVFLAADRWGQWFYDTVTVSVVDNDNTTVDCS